MKINQILVTGSIVLAVVGGALASAGKFVAGSVYCFDKMTMVNQTESCAIQPYTTRSHFKVDPSGVVTTPCNGMDSAFDNASGVCLVPLVRKYSSTGLE